MRLVDVAADHDRVHDGKDLGSRVVSAFDLGVILEEPTHVLWSRHERRRSPRGIEPVQFPVGEHLRERLIRSDTPNLDLRRQVECNLLFAAGLFLTPGPVFDSGGCDTILIAEDTADPYHGSQLILGIANPLANQILRFTDTALCRYEDRTVPAHP